MSDHLEMENSVAAFVLGAAGPEEMESVRGHLAGCAECRLLAARLQRAADVLPLAAELVEPPARLRARILAAAAASDRTPVATPARRRVVRFPARQPRWPSGWLPRRLTPVPIGAFAALCVAVFGLGAWNLQLSSELGRHRTAGQPVSVTLQGRGQLAGAQATLVDFRETSVALVTFSRLPAAPPGKVYEVWLIPASGAPEAVGVFQPDTDGSKTMVMNRDLRNYKVFAVTVEDGPAGVSAPTQQPNLSGTVA